MNWIPRKHCIMSNFRQAPDTMVSALESFLRGDAHTSSTRKAGADEGGACVERLLRAATAAGEAERAERKASSKTSDISPTDIAELNWNAGPVDYGAVRLLLAANDCMPRLVQATHTLLEKLFSPASLASTFESSASPSVSSAPPSASPAATTLKDKAQSITFKDKATTACLLQAAYLFHRYLHQALLESGTPETSKMSTYDDARHTPSLRLLVEFRAKFSRWAHGSGPALELRELTEATLEMAKGSLEARSTPSQDQNAGSPAGAEWGVVLVCLDALLALQRRLLAGEHQHVSSSATGDNGNEMETTGDTVLELLEPVISSIQMSHNLILAWWAADSVGITTAQNSNFVCEAALLAGLPVEASAHNGRDAGEEESGLGGRCQRTAIVCAGDDFCKALLAHTRELAHANSQTHAFLCWDAQVQASLVQGMGGVGGGKDGRIRHLASGVSVTCRLVELVSCLCAKLARIRQGLASSNAGSAQDTAVLDQSMQRLLVLIADLTTDDRLQFVHAECQGWLRSLSASEDTHQQLLDVSNLRRVDAFMQEVGRQQKVLDQHDTSASSVFEHCITVVRELVNDARRSSALVVLYLDCSPVKSPRPPTPVHSISEALAEDEQGQGNIAALLHMVVVSAAPKIIRDVLRLFRAILEKPSSAALARLKPFVRRSVAESLAVMGRPELRALLAKLLLFPGMDSAASPADAPAPTGGDAASGKGPAEALAAAAAAAADTTACVSAQATAQRRGTLRLLTLVLDGVDDSIDRFASELVEALLAFVPALIRMPRPVLKECFAGIKFVCFRQSQGCVERMIDVLLNALNKASTNADTAPEEAANLAEMLAGLVASFQSVPRVGFSDLGSVTSAHVRASDTLSTVSTSSEVSNEGMSCTSRGESTVATSAITYISSTGHMDPDDSSAVGSHIDCASMDMDDDGASIDDEEEMMRESQGLLDEQEVSAEEEERRLASKVCSYTKTSNTFSEQHWYHCWTCGLTLQEGCCAVCAKVCHKGHDITYSRFSRFFCDCGAGKHPGHSCQALHPRDPNAVCGGCPPAIDAGAGGVSGRSPDASAEANASSGAEAQEEEVDISAWLADCEKLPGQLTRQARETLLQKLRGRHVSHVLSNLYDCMVAHMGSRNGALVQQGQGPRPLASLATLHTRETINVQQCVQRRSLKPGSFAIAPIRPPPRSPRAPAAAQGLSQSGASSANADARAVACQSIMSMSTGGMLAVAEGESLQILDIRKKMLDASTLGMAMDKTSVKLLSKTPLAFVPLRVLFNPLCPRHLAVSGHEHCCVYSLSCSGKVSSVVPLELSLQALGSEAGVLDMFWLPNSEVCLVMVTDVVVNVYDLSADPISPIFSVRHPSGERICAATAYTDVTGMGGGVSLLVMLISGALYQFAVEPDRDTHTGPCMLETQVATPQGMQGARGQAVFYSLKSHLLLCGYTSAEADGGGQKLVVARLASGASHVTDWQPIDMSSLPASLGEAAAPAAGTGAPAPSPAAPTPRASFPCIDMFTDVGIAWGQVLLASSLTGAFGILQVTHTVLRILWLHSPQPGQPDRSAVRVCGVAPSTWTRPALAGMLVLLQDGSLQHWAISEQQGLRQPELLLSSSPLEVSRRSHAHAHATCSILILRARPTARAQVEIRERYTMCIMYMNSMSPVLGQGHTAHSSACTHP